MKQSKILQNGTTTEWYAKCYQEYLQSCAQDYQQLIGAIQECAAVDDLEDFDTGVPNQDMDLVLNSLGKAKVEEVLSRYGISSTTYVPFQNGYIKVMDLCLAAIRTAWSQEDVVYDENACPVVLTGGPSEFRLSFIAAVDEMKQSLMSTVVSAAGFAAMTKKSLSDRLALFENQVSQIYSTVPNASNQIVASIRSALQSCETVTDFASGFMSSAINAGVLPDGEGTYSTTDYSAFTGASPTIAADFSSVAKGVDTAFRAGAAVVKGVFDGLFAVGKKLFSMATQYVTDAVIDPEVLVKLENGSGRGTLDGFSWHAENVTETFFAYRVPSIESIPLDKYVGHWYKFETIAGEHLYRINYWSVKDNNSTIVVNYDVRFKPFLLGKEAQDIFANFIRDNYSYFKPGYNRDLDDWSGLPGSLSKAYADMLQTLQNLPTLYGSADLTNGEVYAGYFTAVYLHACILADGCNELRANSDLWGHFEISKSFFNGSSAQYTANQLFDGGASTVSGSNANMLYVGTNDGPGAPTKYNFLENLDDDFLGLIGQLMIIQSYDRMKHPYDYAFIPYSNNAQGFLAPDFRLKTDAEIQSSVTNFINAVVAVVITSVVSVSAFAVVKSIAKKNFFKNSQTISKLDTKMLFGLPLTKREQRQYLRAQRKLNNSKVLDFGNPDVITTGASFNSDAIISLITG